MKSKNRMICFIISAIATAVIAVLMILSCIPRSWGYQSVREFFDLVLCIGPSASPNGIFSWGLGAYFVIFYFITYSLWKGSNLFFLNDNMSTAKKLVYGVVWFILLAISIVLYNHLNYITYFM